VEDSGFGRSEKSLEDTGGREEGNMSILDVLDEIREARNTIVQGNPLPLLWTTLGRWENELSAYVEQPSKLNKSNVPLVASLDKVKSPPPILQLVNEEEGMAWAQFAAIGSNSRHSVPETCQRADDLLLAYRARRVESSESAVCTCEGFLQAREGLHLTGCPAKERQTYVEQLETLNSHYCEEADKIDELIGRSPIDDATKLEPRFDMLKKHIELMVFNERMRITKWLQDRDYMRAAHQILEGEHISGDKS
jgi:hypothetical protein